MNRLIFLFLSVCLMAGCESPETSTSTLSRPVLLAVNSKTLPKGNSVIALVGATLIDGRGGEPQPNSCVIVSSSVIQYAGPAADARIPEGAEVVDVKGLTLLPGLIDSHFHNEGRLGFATTFLRKGITSVRDPGEWIEAFDPLLASGQPLPRLFLAGPHLDSWPPAYPEDAYVVQDAEEARLAVERLAGQGASVIKVYFGLPVGTILAVCAAADRFGLPVTAHLEITNAMDAINAGVDGIEHVTSFGTALLPLREAEQYRQQVIGDDNARRRGRYEMWNKIDLQDGMADSLIRFLAAKRTVMSPTLAAFERRADRADSVEERAFANMLRFAGMAHRGGVSMVVGSHSDVPYAPEGFAYFQEMELLREAGLSPMDVIRAATLENARFFRIDERLGSIEAGKLADLILVEGDPLQDIRVMRQVRKVMLNGVWITP